MSAGPDPAGVVLPPGVRLPGLRAPARAGDALPDLGSPSSPPTTWRDARGQVVARGRPYTGGLAFELVGTGRYLWAWPEQTAVVVPAVDVADDVLADRYARSVIPFFLQAQGVESLHAGAVLTPVGVVAVCGRSGSGKSTTVAGLARLGYPLWADDTVAFVIEDDGEVRALRLPSSLRLLPDAPRWLASRPPRTATDRETPGEQRLAGVVVLERDDVAQPRVEIVPPPAALTALLTHANCFSFDTIDARRRLCEAFLDLVGRVPTARLRFAPGLERLEGVLTVLTGSLPHLGFSP